jgi:hypothetical protein
VGTYTADEWLNLFGGLPEPGEAALHPDLVREQAEDAAAGACGRCHGEGMIEVNPSWRNDPQCVIDAQCPDCGGTGEPS